MDVYKKIINYFFAFIIFLVPVVMWDRPALYIYPKIFISNIAVIIGALAIVFVIVLKRIKFSFKINIFDISYFIFLLYQAISLFWATNIYIGIEIICLEATAFVLYLLYKNFDIKKEIIVASLIGGFFISVYGIFQIANMDFLNKSVKYSYIVVSTLGNKNFLGQFYVYIIFIHFLAFWYFKQKKIRVVLFISFVINFFVFISTLSKTAYLAVFIYVISLCIFIIFIYKEKVFDVIKRFHKKLLIVCMILIVAYFSTEFIPFKVNYTKYYIAYGVNISQKYFSTKQNLRSEINNRFKLALLKIGEFRNIKSPNVKIRLLLYKNSFPLIKQNWMRGVGIGNWQIEYQKYRTLDEKKIEHKISGEGAIPLHAHNEYVEFLSELGVVGFLLFLFCSIILIFYGFKNFFKEKAPDEKIKILLPTLYVLVFMVEANTAFVFHNYPILFSFFIAAYFIIGKEGRILSLRASSIMIAVVLIFSYFLAKQNYKFLKRNYYSTLGHLYKNFNNLKSAAIGFANALYYTPYDYQCNFWLAGVYLTQSNKSKEEGKINEFLFFTRKAREYWQKTVKYNPNLSRAYYNIGNSYFDEATYTQDSKQRIKLFALAEENYKKSIAIFHDYTNAYTNLGNIYATIAIDIITSGSSYEKDSIKELLTNALKYHLKAYNIYAGKEDITADVTVIKNLAIDYYYLGDYKSAIKYFQEYLEKNPKPYDKNEILKTINECKQRIED